MNVETLLRRENARMRVFCDLTLTLLLCIMPAVSEAVVLHELTDADLPVAPPTDSLASSAIVVELVADVDGASAHVSFGDETRPVRPTDVRRIVLQARTHGGAIALVAAGDVSHRDVVEWLVAFRSAGVRIPLAYQPTEAP